MSTKKVPWAQRLQDIKKEYPSFDALDWDQAFQNDLDLMGRIIRDILKHEHAEPGHSGPRPALDRDTAKQKLAQIMGMDYSLEKFPLALATLSSGRSIRHIATKTGLNRNTVHRLLKGDVFPDPWTMEVVAKAFNRHPSFFLEYRIDSLMAALESQMQLAPELTIDVYRQAVRGVPRGRS